jgi:hypothetical protein
MIQQKKIASSMGVAGSRAFKILKKTPQVKCNQRGKP